jgi:hypothetical protein
MDTSYSLIPALSHHQLAPQQSIPYENSKNYDRIAYEIITRFRAFAPAYSYPPFFVLKNIKNKM